MTTLINKATIERFEGYTFTDNGDVISHRKQESGKLLKTQTIHQAMGYQGLKLKDSENNTIKMYSVHRLIYEAFNGPIPKGLVVHHIDGNTSNNKLSNLTAVTHAENTQMAQIDKSPVPTIVIDLKENVMEECQSTRAAARYIDSKLSTSPHLQSIADRVKSVRNTPKIAYKRFITCSPEYLEENTLTIVKNAIANILNTEEL